MSQTFKATRTVDRPSTTNIFENVGDKIYNRAAIVLYNESQGVYSDVESSEFIRGRASGLMEARDIFTGLTPHHRYVEHALDVAIENIAMTTHIARIRTAKNHQQKPGAFPSKDHLLENAFGRQFSVTKFFTGGKCSVCATTTQPMLHFPRVMCESIEDSLRKEAGFDDKRKLNHIVYQCNVKSEELDQTIYIEFSDNFMILGYAVIDSIYA
jgi:hypothetical protein